MQEIQHLHTPFPEAVRHSASPFKNIFNLMGWIQPKPYRALPALHSAQPQAWPVAHVHVKFPQYFLHFIFFIICSDVGNRDLGIAHNVDIVCTTMDARFQNNTSCTAPIPIPISTALCVETSMKPIIQVHSVLIIVKPDTPLLPRRC